MRLLAAYYLRCFRATRRASRLICPSRAISTRTPKKQIHITAMLGVHVIVPVIARPPKVSKTPARPTATTECLIAFWRSPATSLPVTPLGKRSSFLPSAWMRNPIPMNPMPAPENSPFILLLHPPASEIAKYPCETTMATPPPVRSAEPTTQNLTWQPEHPALTPVPDRPGATVLAFRLVYVDSNTCDGGYGIHNDNYLGNYEQTPHRKRSNPHPVYTDKHIPPHRPARPDHQVDCRCSRSHREFY